MIGLAAILVLHFLEIAFPQIYIWLMLFAIGFLITFGIGKKNPRNARVKTLAGKILDGVWIGCLAANMMIFSMPYFFPDVSGRLMTAMIIIVVGIGYFISSFVYNYKWIMYIGFAWWAAAFVVMAFRVPYLSIIVLGILFIFFQVVPGLVLYNKWKKGPSITNE